MAGILAIQEGLGTKGAAEAADVHRTTIYRLRQSDEEWQSLEAEALERLAQAIDTEVALSLQRLRSLADKAMDALEAGLDSTHRYTTVKLDEGYEVVPLPDNSLRVRAAHLLLERIRELAPHLKVEQSDLLARRLEELGDSPSD